MSMQEFDELEEQQLNKKNMWWWILKLLTLTTRASASAVTLGLDNSPPKHVMDNLKTLCERILQPLRDFFGVPIVISSGYRCAALNKAVGGSSSSQHMTGEAADIQIPKTVVKWDDG